MSFSYGIFRIIEGLVKHFYPKPEILGTENLPEGVCVIVGNHTQMHGPIVAELYIPGDRAIWCNAEMMNLKEVPDYAFQDFWSEKPPCKRWFYRLLSYVIAPLSVCVFNNARCIGVYHDSRILSTFRRTLERMKEGANIVIFPEHDPPLNNILSSFQEHFIDLGRMYERQTGQPLAFVPMYIAPALNKVYLCEPVYYNSKARPDEERQRISKALSDAITEKARSLPRHRVVPYRNIPKHLYPYNDTPSA